MKRTISLLLLSLLLALGIPGPGQTQTSYPFSDGAEDEGTSTGFWTFDPEDSPWEIRATAAYSGDQVWSIVPDGTWRYLTLAGTVDLSAASNPTLAFWLRAVDGDTHYSVDVSSDGGATWESVKGGTWYGSSYGNPGWGRVVFSLESFRTQNVLVRIGSLTGQTLQIDDILIDNAPMPQVIRMTEPTNNGFRLSWNASTADDFRQYRIVLDTDANQVNRVNDWANTEALVQSRRERRVIDITDQATTELVLDDLVFANTRYYAKFYEQDTQDLWNQGSERAQSQTTFRTTAEVAPFVQDFEGSFGWAADLPWAVTEEAGGESGHSGTHAWSDSPVGSGAANYAPYADRWLVMEMDLWGVVRPLLRFKHRYIFEQNIDWGRIAYSTNNVNWTELAWFTGIEGLWRTEEFDLSVLGRSQAYLRFQITSDSGTERDGWHLDDVAIAENSLTLPFPFSDDVEDAAVSRRNWIDANWSVQPTAAHSGDQVWSIVPNGNIWSYLTLAGTVDLTAASNPTLAFWLRAVDGDTHYSVDVSSDGGATWESVQRGTWYGSSYGNPGWGRVVFSLESFRTQNVLVRIGSLTGQTLQIDDILIDFPPSRLGDVSGDGEVTAFDAALLLRYVVGLSPLGNSGMASADVTGNGTISPLDAALILRFAAQLISIFPAESAGKPVASAGGLEWAEARPGDAPERMILPLVLGRDAHNVTSVQLSAAVDPALVELEGISSSLPAGWQLAHHVEDGELKLVMAGATPVEAGELAQLHLRLLRPEARAEVGGRAFVNENPVRELAPVALRSLPAAFALRQNYPNPFNPTTQIQYQLASSAAVRLTIFNLVGQTVRTLVSGVQPAGLNIVEWEGRSDAGERVESGVYLYRLETSGFVQTRKMVLVQ